MYSTVNNNRDVKKLDKNGDPAFNVVVANPEDISGGSGSNLSVGIAEGTVSAVKCLFQNVAGVSHANNNVDLSQATVIGISSNAATDGNQVKYQKRGEYFDSSLNFTLNDPLYLDVNGNITDVAPSASGTYIVQIGTALVNGINIEIQIPILNP